MAFLTWILGSSYQHKYEIRRIPEYEIMVKWDFGNLGGKKNLDVELVYRNYSVGKHFSHPVTRIHAFSNLYTFRIKNFTYIHIPKPIWYSWKTSQRVSRKLVRYEKHWNDRSLYPSIFPCGATSPRWEIDPTSFTKVFARARWPLLDRVERHRTQRARAHDDLLAKLIHKHTKTLVQSLHAREGRKYSVGFGIELCRVFGA